jgi:g-D-glutamyl-meso-diaminopimelate peptidase
LADIKTLKKQYPGLVDYAWFGKSAAGVNIPVVTLGKGPKKILIVAAMHPAEHVTSLQVMRSIDTYACAYAKKQKIDGISVRDVLDRVTFYFVPTPNPDGIAIVMGTANAKQKALAVKAVGEKYYRNNRALHWKGNANAVNLNRNFPAKWADQEKAYRKPTSLHYPGKAAASEPETKALMELCRAHDFAFMLSDHTYGQVLYWNDPYTGTIPGAASLLNKLKKATGYRPDTTLPYYNGGRFEKWFRYTFNRPAVVVEMLPSGYGIPKSYANFDRMLWKRTRSLFLQVADCGAVTGHYKLYFDANQGKVETARKNVTLARPVGKLPRPTRTGYSFAGWYTKKSGGTEITAETQLTENRSLQLYAHWKKR